MDQETSMPSRASAWIESTIGAFRLIRTHRDASDRTSVWEIERAGERFFFKTHNRRYKWGSELLAYRSWTAAFSPYVSELLAALDEPDQFGLLVRGIEGSPMRERDLSEAQAADVYQRTGSCLRRLYDQNLDASRWFGCAVSDQGFPLTDAEAVALGRTADPEALVGRMLIDMERRCGPSDRLGSTYRERLDALVPLVSAFAGEHPVPVNTDFTPGNWLVDSSGNLTAVIDFEDMFYGFRIGPFIRLIADYFPANDRFRVAFLEGFGVDLPGMLPEQTAVLLTLHGLGFLISDRDRNDDRHRQRGELALHLADRILR